MFKAEGAVEDVRWQGGKKQVANQEMVSDWYGQSLAHQVGTGGQGHSSQKPDQREFCLLHQHFDFILLGALEEF